MSRRIACIGEAMVEIVVGDVPGNATLGFAGDTLNTAVYLRRLLPVADEVSYLTAVGGDQISEAFVRFLQSEDIGTQAVTRDPHRTMGLYAIETDAAGERCFTYWRSQSAARGLFSGPAGPDFSILDRYELIYLSAITLAILPDRMRTDLISWLGAFRSRGGLVAFDSNYRPQLWADAATARRAIDSMWKACDIALPSIDDELALFGSGDQRDVLDRFAGYGPTAFCLKCGARGPISLAGEGISQPDEHPLRVTDTTGAGDSFNAGFMAAWLAGSTLEDAMSQGHDLARHVVGHAGAIIPKAEWDEWNRPAGRVATGRGLHGSSDAR